MKKTYMQPSILLTKVGVHRMICVSDPHVMINYDGYVEAGDVESRRHHSVWDDDDYDE